MCTKTGQGGREMSDPIAPTEEFQLDGFEELLKRLEDELRMTKRSKTDRDTASELLNGQSSVITFAQKIKTRFGKK